MKHNLRAIGLAAVLCMAQPMMAETKPLEMRWNELAPLINGQRVEVILNDGLKVKGEVIAVREDGLLLDAKGNRTVPRASLAQINLERRRGAWGRTLGTVLGVLTGMTLGGYAAAHTDSAGAGIPTFLGVSAAVSTGGYYLGKRIDRRITKIRIVAQ
jgi:hypothetical protein